jgi:protein-tyrosine phosphatase
MSGFTDIHSHFIYGVDDGAKSLDIMQSMLTDAYNNNISRLIATPHVIPGMKPFDSELFECHCAEARDFCSANGYDIEILTGAENLYTPAFPGYAERHGLIGLAGSRYILVEFIPDAELREIRDAVEFLSFHGYIPVIAHVERYKNLSYREACRLKDYYKIIYQMNCGTILRSGSFFQNLNMKKFLKSHLISCISSDAHNCDSRRFRMAEAFEAVKNDYGLHYANEVTGRH